METGAVLSPVPERYVRVALNVANGSDSRWRIECCFIQINAVDPVKELPHINVSPSNWVVR